jgi:Holliday junction resolvasome RuvABC endonuclease subunit
MPVVLGLDPSLTSAGIAMLRDGRPILLRSVGTATDIKDWEHRVRRITRQTWNIVRLIESKARPDLAMIEAPLTFGTDGDAYDRYALFVELMRQLQAWKTPTVVVHNLTRCKWATGKGGKSSKELTTKQHKREVMLAVRATWEPWAGHITNDDIADALTLAEIGARYLDEPLHFTPRRRHIEAMRNSIAWPSDLCVKPETMQVGATQ